MSAPAARLDRLSPGAYGALITEGPRTEGPEPLGVDALRALAQVDRALAPEEADLEGRVRAGRFGDNGPRSSDDLRLPPPPRMRQAPQEMVAATGRTLERFRAQAQQPIGAPAEALVAEGRMMAVLGGIDRLKMQIRARAEQSPLG